MKKYLDEVLKSISTKGTFSDLDLGKVHLKPEHYRELVKKIQNKTTFLDWAGFVKMDSHTLEISNVGYNGRVLRGGYDSNGDKRDLTSADASKPVIQTEELVAKKLRAVIEIEDDASILSQYGEETVDVILDMMADEIAYDIEVYVLHSNKNIQPASSQDILHLENGIIAKAGKQLTQEDFDHEDIVDIFTALQKAIPRKAFRNRANWAFFVDFETELEIRELYRKRETGMGDSFYIKNEELYFDGFRVVTLDSLSDEEALENTGRVVMLLNREVATWGLFQEVTMEKDRDAYAEVDRHIARVWPAAGHKNPEYSAVAFLEETGTDGTD